MKIDMESLYFTMIEDMNIKIGNEPDVLVRLDMIQERNNLLQKALLNESE